MFAYSNGSATATAGGSYNLRARKRRGRSGFSGFGQDDQPIAVALPPGPGSTCGSVSAGLKDAIAIGAAGRTIPGREVAFPLVDAFKPAEDVRIEVSEYGRGGTEPFRFKRELGREYYGLSGLDAAGNKMLQPFVLSGLSRMRGNVLSRPRHRYSPFSPFSGPRAAMTRARHHHYSGLGEGQPGAVTSRGRHHHYSGLGFLDPGGDASVYGFPTIGPGNVPAQPGGSNGGPDDGSGIDWGAILQQTIGTVPAIISSAKGGPGGYYGIYAPGTTYRPGGYQLPGANIGATAGAAAGNIGDAFAQIVYQHPYVVLGILGGAVLLFMKPPGRRR